MALNQEEKDQFGRNIVQQLSQTPYACPSLTILSGGTANFLFRGTLSQPLPDGAKTVVVKHSKKFVSANRNFQLDISRCVSFPFASRVISVSTLCSNTDTC
jgi:hypothetical protein